VGYYESRLFRLIDYAVLQSECCALNIAMILVYLFAQVMQKSANIPNFTSINPGEFVVRSYYQEITNTTNTADHRGYFSVEIVKQR